ncbi:MAG: Ig-like domain-containing protein, partial [Pseudomonadota bacterium]
ADGAEANNSAAIVIPDVKAPTIAITSNVATLVAGQNAIITFTLSEASTTFALSDVAVTGGTLSNFSGSGTTYTATFTPVADGAVNAAISVASGSFTDAAGNSNADGAEANNSAAIVIPDVKAPTIAITSNVATLVAGQNAIITFTLSEASTTFDLSDIAVTGGSLSNFTGSGTTYTASFTPDANGAASASISVASGSLSDAAGNVNVDGADTNNTLALTVPAPVVPALGAPQVLMIEDSDNDGHLSKAELQGNVNVRITLPSGVKPGDILSVADGNVVKTIALTAQLIQSGVIDTEFAAPAVNTSLTVTASVTPPGGQQGASGSDQSVRGSGTDLTFASISDDTGIIGDFVTTDNTLVLRGTAESGETVNIIIDGVLVGTTIAVNDEWSFDNTATPLPRGAHAITVSIGNLTGETVTKIVQIFAADLDPASDNGPSASDHITSDITPNFILTAGGIMQVGDTARLLDPDGSVVGSTIVSAADMDAGTVNVPTRQLNDGAYVFTAQIVAPDGQVRVSQPVNVTVVTDLDGVLPLTEVAANGGDFNRDGVLDWQQNNVVHLPLTSLAAFEMGAQAPASSFGAIIAGNLTDSAPAAAVVLDASAQLLKVGLITQPAPLPSNTTAATPTMKFSVTGIEGQVLNDLDPSRAGLQTRVVIDLPAGVTANQFLKFDAIAKAWFSFMDDQRLDTIDDGATLLDLDADGKIDRVVITLTDGARGDEDGVANGIVVDPGMLAYVSKNPVHSILLANGDRYYTTSAAEAAQYAKGTGNVYEGVRFDSLDSNTPGHQMQARWQPFTEDWFFGSTPGADPYLCYEAAPGAGFRAANPGAGGGTDFHLFMDIAGHTQLVSMQEANALGLATQGYTDRGVQFNTTTSSAFVFDAEGYLIANRDNASIQAFVRTLATQFLHSSDAGFIEAVEQFYLTQITVVGNVHGGVASAADLNLVFGTSFLI